MNPPNRTKVIEAARIAALIAGCNCDLEIEIEVADEINLAHVRHDPWCALLTRQPRRWN